MEFVLLIIELKKVALRGLRFAVGFVLPLAILNLSLGATPARYKTRRAPGKGQEIELVHMQMFGGLIHLHDGSGADHNAVRPLPPGVTEQEYQPNSPGITPKGRVAVKAPDS